MTVERSDMWQKELKTPVGRVHIYKNGQKMYFQARYFDYGMYLNDNTLKKPQGIYKLYPDIENLEKGDTILCEFEQGYLWPDGGDEFMLNIVGTVQGYTIGMGAPDSRDIENHYPQKERILPYETRGNTEKGFEIHIIDTPKGYPLEAPFQELCFVVAWEPGTTSEARNLISFVTC